MPRPKSLDEATIAAAVLAILDRNGLPALSMRSVADELGIGTMSLYRYVADREQLERCVVEHVVSGVNLELPRGAKWPERVAILLERARATCAAHPAVVPLALLHRHRCVGTARWAEVLLGVLSEAGFKGAARVFAFRSLLSYFAGALQTEHLGPLSGPGTAALAELPREAFPLLGETARDAQRIDPEDEFRSGLAFLIRGLEQAATTAPTRSARGTPARRARSRG